MIPLFGDPMAGGKRWVLEGRLISVALQALRLGTSVVLDYGLWAAMTVRRQLVSLRSSSLSIRAARSQSVTNIPRGSPGIEPIGTIARHGTCSAAGARIVTSGWLASNAPSGVTSGSPQPAVR